MNPHTLKEKSFVVRRSIYTVILGGLMLIVASFFIDEIVSNKNNIERFDLSEIYYLLQYVGLGMLFSGSIILGQFNNFLKKIQTEIKNSEKVPEKDEEGGSP